MRAFVMAAGLGTRMGELTRRTPKCLLAVGGKPLLGRWFDELARIGVERALVNTHYLAEQVRSYVETCAPPLRVDLAHEQELLGSGGMLAANRDFVDGEDAFLVVYADNASTMDVGELVGAHEPDVAATLALFRVADPERRGVVALDAAGCVSEFVEKPARPRSNLAWAGLLVGSPELLAAVPEDRPCDLGRMVLPTLVGRMRGVEVEGYHADIGTPESYDAALRDFDRIARSA